VEEAMSLQLVDEEVWSSEATDIPSVGRALHKLRLAVRTDEDEAAPREVTEAAVLNLVVISTDDQALDEAAAVISELSARHPSRSILCRRDETSTEEKLSAEVTAYCTFTPGSERQICCEQVRVVLQGSYAERVHSLIEPLLLPDIPTFVWWRGQPPFASTMFDKLRHRADRMVVDSSGFRSAFLELLTETATCDREHCAMSDLAWSRLEEWRERVASLFDPQDAREHLWQLRRVIVVAATPGYPTEGVLMLGWLAHQLGWNVSERLSRAGNAWVCSFNSGGRAVTCEIFNEDVARPTLSGLSRLELASENAMFLLEASPDGDLLYEQVRVNDQLRFEAASGLKARSLAAIVGQELGTVSGDPVYAGALAIAAELVGATT
jgi:glucose-6-phosphate dehydrogenase assembly protein OpcA